MGPSLVKQFLGGDCDFAETESYYRVIRRKGQENKYKKEGLLCMKSPACVYLDNIKFNLDKASVVTGLLLCRTVSACHRLRLR